MKRLREARIQKMTNREPKLKVGQMVRRNSQRSHAPGLVIEVTPTVSGTSYLYHVYWAAPQADDPFQRWSWYPEHILRSVEEPTHG